MFSIVGGYQGVAKIARDRTRTEQQKPSNIPQKKETIKYTTEKGNHLLLVAVSNCKFENWELPPAGKRNAP